jgi:hypothetical protein
MLIITSPVANDQNTRTQWLNLYDQMKKGARYFDLRPVQGNGGQYLLGHYSNTKSTLKFQGCNGELISDAVKEANH